MSNSIPRPYSGQPTVPIRVEWIVAGQTWFIRTLTADYAGLMWHVDPAKGKQKAKFHYCTMADDGECKRCATHEQTWKGYVAADLWVQQDKGFWKPIVFEMPEAIEPIMRLSFRRGLVWEIHRPPDTPKKKNFPTEAYSHECIDDRYLPQPFSILPALQRFLHRIPKALSIPNPMPAAVEGELLEGAPPAALGAQKAPAVLDEAELQARRDALQRMRAQVSAIDGKKQT